MTDLSVHQDPYQDQPQQFHQLSVQPPGVTFFFSPYNIFHRDISAVQCWVSSKK